MKAVTKQATKARSRVEAKAHTVGPRRTTPPPQPGAMNLRQSLELALELSDTTSQAIRALLRATEASRGAVVPPS